MEDILDFNDDNSFVDYLFLQTNQLEAVLELLKKNNLIYKVKTTKHHDNTNLVPLTAEKLLNRSDYTIQIPKNLHLKVDELMEENPDILADSRNVRKLFFLNAFDNNGLIDVLLFPEEWTKRDAEIAIEILESKGIVIPPEEYDDRREERITEKENNLVSVSNRKQRKGVLLFFILVFITSLFWVLSYVANL